MMWGFTRGVATKLCLKGHLVWVFGDPSIKFPTPPALWGGGGGNGVGLYVESCITRQYWLWTDARQRYSKFQGQKSETPLAMMFVFCFVKMPQENRTCNSSSLEQYRVESTVPKDKIRRECLGRKGGGGGYSARYLLLVLHLYGQQDPTTAGPLAIWKASETETFLAVKAFHPWTCTIYHKAKPSTCRIQ